MTRFTVFSDEYPVGHFDRQLDAMKRAERSQRISSHVRVVKRHRAYPFTHLNTVYNWRRP